MFIALKYAQELEKAGFARDQAEASVRILIDVMNENFATKSDLRELELKIEAATQRLEARIDSLGDKLTIKLGAMLTIAIGILATLKLV